MVEAVFKKKTIWNIMFMSVGLLLIGLFVFLRYADGEATSADTLSGILFGAIVCLFGVITFPFNFKAHLSIKDGRIKGRYHYFGRIDCNVSDVCFVLAQVNTLTIQLKNGKSHTIFGIENSFVLCSVMRRNMPFEAKEQPDEMIKSLDKLKSDNMKCIILVCSGIALMFINIFITVFLTGEKELNEFGKADWIIFLIMSVIEIAVIIATFYFAQKTGKHIIPIRRLKYDIQRTIIETTPPLPGKVLYVFADEEYTGRITIFGYPNCNDVYYSVEKLDSDYALPKVYVSGTYEDAELIPIAAEALIDITDKVMRR